MKKIAEALKREFVSSSGLTQQFADFYHLFQSKFSQSLRKRLEITKIKFHRGHFYISGFFQITDGRIWYFSLGDVRWGSFRGQLLIRTAQSFQDYTGGTNHFVTIHDMDGLQRIVSQQNREVICYGNTGKKSRG
jgi:hypothetical protein